jgi:hypothetical protein
MPFGKQDSSTRLDESVSIVGQAACLELPENGAVGNFGVPAGAVAGKPTFEGRSAVDERLGDFATAEMSHRRIWPTKAIFSEPLDRFLLPQEVHALPMSQSHVDNPRMKLGSRMAASILSSSGSFTLCFWLRRDFSLVRSCPRLKS